METERQGNWVQQEGGKAFFINHRVRYSDTDKMDMVYHGSYIPMLEAARVDTLREIGWVYSEMEKEGVLLPVVDMSIKYFIPARYDQMLRIECHVLDRPTARLKFSFRILHNESLLVKAEVCLAFVDAETGRPRRAPEGLVASLEKHSLIHS